eukprot:1153035-Pelagomonas_calceolata.AAC.13
MDLAVSCARMVRPESLCVIVSVSVRAAMSCVHIAGTIFRPHEQACNANQRVAVHINAHTYRRPNICAHTEAQGGSKCQCMRMCTNVQGGSNVCAYFSAKE